MSRNHLVFCQLVKKLFAFRVNIILGRQKMSYLDVQHYSPAHVEKFYVCTL